MASENDLIQLVKENNSEKDFAQAGKYKINQLKKDKFGNTRTILIKIIPLLYSNGKIEFGPYLSSYKSKIINLIYNGYKTPLQSILLFRELYKLEKYGIILRFLNEVENLRNEQIYDFFQILTKEKTIKDILEKYIIKKIEKTLPFNMKINSVDDLIQLINKSACFKDDKYDYIIFYNYIMAEEKKKKNEKQLKKNAKKDIVKNPFIPKYEQEKKNEQPNILPQKEVEKANENISLNINHEIQIENNTNNNNEIKTIEKSNDNTFNDKGVNIKEKEISPLIKYFKERKKYFADKDYKTPILDKLIDEELHINEKLFLLKKPKEDYLIEPHYINLEKVIKIFNDPHEFEQKVLKDKNYGYFCYCKLKKNEYQYREGIYAHLENTVLYSEITNKNKFEKENIEEENKSIVDNCLKARGLSLEYYINGIFMDILNQKELPRAIYNFDPDILNEKKEDYNNLNEINNIDVVQDQDENDIEEHYDKAETNENEIQDKNSTDENKIDNKAQEKKSKIISMEELDGIFYLDKPLENYFEIPLSELPFIIDDILEIQNTNFGFTAENAKFISLQRKTLLLFEVKTRFPEYDKIVKEIKIALSKAKTFYHLYEERFPDIQKLRIMFFYNAIPKKNYDNILLKTVKDYFGENDIKNKIQFQFIFITSSYLAYNFKTLKDDNKNLKADLNNLKEEVQNIKDKYKELETQLKLYIENHHNTDENQKGNGKNQNENNNP